MKRRSFLIGAAALMVSPAKIPAPRASQDPFEAINVAYEDGIMKLGFARDEAEALKTAVRIISSDISKLPMTVYRGASAFDEFAIT